MKLVSSERIIIMPNFYVIHNPQAGNQAHGDIISQIKHLRPIVRWYDTQYAGHAVNLAKTIANTVSDPEAVVLAIGGDGTLNEVLNGLLQVQRAQLIPVAYIPLGSGNDFARAAHLGTATTALQHLKQTTQAQQLNIGRLTDDGLYHTTRYFVNNLGIGFDALVVERTNQSPWKNRLNRLGLGHLSYLATTLAAFFQQQAFQMTVTSGNQYQQFTQAFLVTITNQPFFGGGIALLPTADLTHAGLDLVIAEKMSFFQFVKLFIALKKDGSHLTHPNITTISLQQGGQLYIRDMQPGQVDGETLQPSTFGLTIDYQPYPFWL